MVIHGLSAVGLEGLSRILVLRLCCATNPWFSSCKKAKPAEISSLSGSYRGSPRNQLFGKTTDNNMLGEAGQFCAPMPGQFLTLSATEVSGHLAQTSAKSAHAPDRVCFGRANLSCTEARLQSPSLVSVERICGIFRKSGANKKKSLAGSTGHSITGASTPTDFAADNSFRSSVDSGNWVRNASSRYMAS